MKDVIFITGNEHKAEYLRKYLGHPVAHQRVDLDEIQSLDFTEVLRHKVREAYRAVGKAVLVEDAGVEFLALGRLPGPLIKWFIEDIGLDGLCRLLDGKDRSAIARCVFGYFDGETERYFEGSMPGSIPEYPTGTGGFGWDTIFIPEGYTSTRAELSPEDDEKTYLTIKPFAAVKEFLLS